MYVHAWMDQETRSGCKEKLATKRKHADQRMLFKAKVWVCVGVCVCVICFLG